MLGLAAVQVFTSFGLSRILYNARDIYDGNWILHCTRLENEA